MTFLDRTELLGRAANQALRDISLLALRARPTQEVTDRLRSLSEPTLSRLLNFAERNDIGPIAAAAVLRAFDSDEDTLLAAWRETYNRSGQRMRAFLSELDGVAARLARDGIQLVALKNAGIARGIYPDPACCPMGDLDVLVDRARFRDAHRLILELGFTHASRSTVEPADLEHGLASGGTEYLKRAGEHDVWFELQWRPIAGRWIPQHREPDGALLIGRSVPIPGTDVRLLSPEDNMLQVALHTAKHSYVRAPGLRLHTDVDRLTAFAPPDWTRVVELATEVGAKTATYFSLAIARALLRTPVPEHVLEALAPPAWKRAVVTRWLRAVDLFEPHERKFRRPGLLAFQSLLYDDVTSIKDSLSDAPGRFRVTRAARRLADLLTRYQP